MAVEMMPCPKCGALNSAKKKACYNCEQDLKAPPPVVPAHPATPQPMPPTPAPAPAEQPFSPPPEPAASATPAQRAVQRPFQVPQPDATGLVTPRQGLRATALYGATLMQRIRFYRQLHSMLQAGISLTQALYFLVDNVPVLFRHVCRDIAANVQNGVQLSRAMARYGNVFPEWELYVVQAAEISGALPEAIADIAETLEMEASVRQQVNSATFSIRATVVVAILVFLVVGAAGSANGSATTLLSNLGHAVLVFAIIIFGVIIAIRLWRIFSRTRAGARFVNTIITMVPMVGPLVRNTMRIRFVRILSTLWGAGVSPQLALEASARASGNLYAMHQVRSELKRLGEGASIADVLENIRLLPPEALHLVRAGETSGNVSEMLQKAAEYIRIDLEAQAKTLPVRLQLLFYALIVPPIAYFIIKFWQNYYSKALGPF